MCPKAYTAKAMAATSVTKESSVTPIVLVQLAGRIRGRETRVGGEDQGQGDKGVEGGVHEHGEKVVPRENMPPPFAQRVLRDPETAHGRGAPVKEHAGDGPDEQGGDGGGEPELIKGAQPVERVLHEAEPEADGGPEDQPVGEEPELGPGIVDPERLHALLDEGSGNDGEEDVARRRVLRDGPDIGLKDLVEAQQEDLFENERDKGADDRPEKEGPEEGPPGLGVVPLGLADPGEVAHRGKEGEEDEDEKYDDLVHPFAG
jgi:hypothetical protein